MQYRVVGDVTRETSTGVPPVLVAGTPGIGYEYLENLEALTISDRRVIEVTFSATAPIETCGLQLAAVCNQLKVPTVHVVAHGLGAPAALSVAAEGSGLGVRSLSLVSPYGALSDLREAARATILATSAEAAPDPLPFTPPPSAAVEPAPFVPAAPLKDCSVYKSESAIAYCEKKNRANAPPPAPPGPPPPAVVKVFGRAGLIPTVSSNARGTCIVEAQASVDAKALGPPPVLGPLFREAEAQQLQSLGGLALSKRLAPLAEANLPILLVSGGSRDLVDPSGWSELPAATQRVTLEGSGHLPMIEQRDEFLDVLLQFLDKADGKTTNREFKFADPVQTVKELL